MNNHFFSPSTQPETVTGRKKIKHSSGVVLRGEVTEAQRLDELTFGGEWALDLMREGLGSLA